MNCPNCSEPLHGLATRCWAGGDGCGWSLGKAEPVPGGGTKSKPKLPPDSRTEKEIQLAIRRAFEFHGWTVADMSQSRATQQFPGFSDLVCFHAALKRILFVEVKTPTGKQSEYQREMELIVTEAGGTYLLMRHENEVGVWHDAEI